MEFETSHEISPRSFIFTRSLLFLFSTIFFILATIGLYLISGVVYLPPFIAYFLFWGVIFCSFSFLFLKIGIKIKNIKNKLLSVIGAFLLIIIAWVTYIQCSYLFIYDVVDIFLMLGAIFYGLSFLFLKMGIKIKNIAKKLQKFYKSAPIIAGILLFLLISVSYIQVSDLTATDTIVFYPRENSIDVDLNYKFTTQFGGLNETAEGIVYFPDAPPTNFEAYSWHESYVIRQLGHVYNVTKDPVYLDLVIERMDAIVSESDHNNDGVPGYGKTILGYYYIDFVVSDGMILHPMLELANMLKNGSNQTLFQKYKPNFDSYVALSEKIINRWNDTNWVEFTDENTGELSGCYLAPLENIQLIFNRNNAMGRLFLELYQYTNNIIYKQMVVKIAQFFKENLQIHTYDLPWDSTSREMYYWGYSVVIDSASDLAKIVNKNIFSDTSHASIDVSFVDMCYRNGIVFNAIDMQRFANTFVDFVYRGRVSETGVIVDGVTKACNFADSVSGNSAGQYYEYVRSGWFELAKYYRNQTFAAYMLFTALQDMIVSESYIPIHTSLILLITIENIYLNHDFPYGTSFY